MKATLVALAAIGAQACQRERAFQHHPHKHVKRQSVFPPALTPNEEILLNSFDAVSISEWSYYYSIAHQAQQKAYADEL
jgi:N-acetylated-alpha-linked acidic dipeptidase